MTEAIETPAKIIKKQVCRILPYFDPRIPNMGLEKYNMVLHEGSMHSEQLAYIAQSGGKRRYLTGLNEYAPEVMRITDPTDRAAKIQQIRENVIRLEKQLNANDTLDIKDDKFWSKVQSVFPDNYTFWDTFILKAGNEPVFIDPETPTGLITILAIEAGGFPFIAKSYEDARIAATPPKFYLDKGHETAASKNDITKAKNKAITALTELSEKNPGKLFLIVKNIDPNSVQYTKNTSPEIIYNNLDTYINGNGFERGVKKASARFLELVGTDVDELTISAVVSDASFHKIIVPSTEGLMHSKTHTTLGKGTKEAYEFLKNPVHKDVWDSIYSEIKAAWQE